MSHQKILPPPPTVEDTMDNVVLTPYNRSECACNFEGWQELPQCGLLSLLPHSFPLVAPSPSTDSSLKTVIHSVPLQFQPPCRKVKPLNAVRTPPQAIRNSKTCELNYNTCGKRRKQLLYKSKNSRTSRQSTQGCSNALPPMCRILPTLTLHTKHN